MRRRRPTLPPSEVVPLHKAILFIGQPASGVGGLVVAWSHAHAALIHGRGAVAHGVVNGIAGDMRPKWWKHVMSIAEIYRDRVLVDGPQPFWVESITLTGETVNMIIRKALRQRKTALRPWQHGIGERPSGADFLAKVHQAGGRPGGAPKGSGRYAADYPLLERVQQLRAEGYSKRGAALRVAREVYPDAPALRDAAAERWRKTL